jgi:hypothetical protein
MTDDSASAAIFGVTEQDFKLWKHHPVSKVVAQYCADYREALIKQHLAEWMAGKIEEARDLEMRGRIAQLDDVGGLTFDSIATFYPQPEKPDEIPSAQILPTA